MKGDLGNVSQGTGSEGAEQTAAWSWEDSNWSVATGQGATALQRSGTAVSKVTLQP